MLAGYMSHLLVLIMGILLATGWKEELFGRTLRRSWLMLGLALWVALVHVHVPLGKYACSLAWFLLVAGLMIYRSKQRIFERRGHGLLISLIIAAVLLLYDQLVYLEPRFFLLHPRYDASLLLGMCILLFTRSPMQQLTIVTLSLTVFQFAQTAFHPIESPPVPIGDTVFFDQWLLVFILCRTVSILMERGHGILKGLLQPQKERE
ncbi:YphA family membrane protein [Marinicrinis sediminis]|uniref:Lycopene cyclase domain-containing protein n=1 Tax=Marinicrinis sediminis TaxID=1652465 RepID=A0ABW5RDR3_9BACL